MIRCATREEVMSDCFLSFCQQHSLNDRHGNVNRYWEYPWAYFRAQPMMNGKILDVGAGYSSFLLNIQCAGTNATCYASDPCFTASSVGHLPGVQINNDPVEQLSYEDGFFDTIFCLSVLEHINEQKQIEGMREMARCLKPGGRLIITVDYFIQWDLWEKFRNEKASRLAWLPNNANADILKLVRASGLRLMVPTSIIDLDEWVNTELSHQKLWYSEHIRTGLKVTTIGIALFKPYLYQEILNKKFVFSPEAIHIADDESISVVQHKGVNFAPITSSVRLPLKLEALTRPIPLQELIEWIDADSKKSVQVIQEWIQNKIILEVNSDNNFHFYISRNTSIAKYRKGIES